MTSSRGKNAPRISNGFSDKRYSVTMNMNPFHMIYTEFYDMIKSELLNYYHLDIILTELYYHMDDSKDLRNRLELTGKGEYLIPFSAQLFTLPYLPTSPC